MPTLTRFVAAVATAAAVPACSVIASSAAHADPVATTATVLKVVDGDTVDSPNSTLPAATERPAPPGDDATRTTVT